MPPKLAFLNCFQDRNGRWRSFYRRAGQRIEFSDAGEPNTPAWLARYHEIHAGFVVPERATDAPTRPVAKTVAAAIESYRHSDRYLLLSQSAKDNYRREWERFPQAFLDLPLQDVTRYMLVRLVEQTARKSERRAKEVIKVLSLVFRNAYNRGLMTANLTPKGDPLPSPATYRAEPHRPWTEDEIATFLKGATPIWRRAVMVLLHTGLRLGDARQLQRQHIKDGFIEIDTSKTGAAVAIPVHGALAAELATPLPVESMFLIAGARGGQVRRDVLSHGIAKECRRLGIEPSPPAHGLRKCAVMRLLEAGCDEGEIHAITGQSKEMIRHYGQAFNRRKLAASALLKLVRSERVENGSDTEPDSGE